VLLLVAVDDRHGADAPGFHGLSHYMNCVAGSTTGELPGHYVAAFFSEHGGEFSWEKQSTLTADPLP
jgi:hypothetical protein